MSDSDSRPTKEFTGPVRPGSRGGSSVDTDPYAPTLVPESPILEAEPAGPDPLLGVRVGDYQIIERIGSGGMGVVYAGIQPIIGKSVAIKVLRSAIASDPRHAERLFFEARAVAQIRHRGIIDIFTVGQLPDGRHYLVMEMLDGESLQALLRRRGALPPSEAVVILDEILSALGAAHAAGIVHRDLKPSNVFVVTQSDGSTFVKLLDFGLAKRTDGDARQSRSSVFVGTPEYIAPEQARGQPVGPLTDLYAAGVMLFELLTGRLPFVGDRPFDVVLQHLEKTPPLPSSVVPSVPPALDELTRRLLAKDPAQRPKSADEVRREVARIARVLQVQADVGHASPAQGSDDSFVLRLGTRFELGLSWITPALDELFHANPRRNIHLAFGDSPDLIRQLRDAQIDCAVTSARLRGEWIKKLELHEETYALVAGPGLELDEASVAQLSLLDVHPDLPLFRYFSDALARAREWKFRRVEVLGTIAAVRHRVLEGAGIAVLPTYFIAEQLRLGVLRTLFPEIPLQRDCFRLIWRDGHPREAEIEQLGAQLRRMPLR